MNNVALTIFIAGVLLYKTVELSTALDKVEQTCLRATRLKPVGELGGGIWRRIVEAARDDRASIWISYWFVVVLVFGELAILAQPTQGLAVVSIVLSTFIALLNLSVERYRKILEHTHH